MDDLSLVRAELAKLDYKDLPQLESESGVPVGTSAKIKCGETKNPRYDTVRLLANHFRARASREQERTA
jgi:hypothetical protein